MKTYKLVLVENIDQLINNEDNIIFVTENRTLYQLYKSIFPIYSITVNDVEHIMQLVLFLNSKNIVITSYIGNKLEKDKITHIYDDGKIMQLEKEIKQKNILINKQKKLLSIKTDIIISFQERKAVRFANKFRRLLK